jgi:hypothetical protein
MIIRLTQKHFAIQVPGDAYDLRIRKNTLEGYKRTGCILFERELPEMSLYIFLFLSNSVTEERAARVVEKISQWEKELWHNYNAPGRDFRDIVESGFETSVESFDSLLKSKNLEGVYAILEKSEPNVIQEYILCAATWYKEQSTAELLPKNIKTGVVLCGYRHGDIVYQFLALTGKRSVLPECGEYEQGFITNKNRFVGRKEAFDIARIADQIKGPNKGQSENSIGLTSEDLY